MLKHVNSQLSQHRPLYKFFLGILNINQLLKIKNEEIDQAPIEEYFAWLCKFAENLPKISKFADSKIGMEDLALKLKQDSGWFDMVTMYVVNELVLTDMRMGIDSYLAEHSILERIRIMPSEGKHLTGFPSQSTKLKIACICRFKNLKLIYLAINTRQKPLIPLICTFLTPEPNYA